MVLRQVSTLKLLLLSALLHAIQYGVASQTTCELKSHTHLYVYYMYKNYCDYEDIILVMHRMERY